MGDRGPVLSAPAMWLIAQERIEVAGPGEVPQGLAQQLGLAGNRGRVEAQIDGVDGHRPLIDLLAGRGSEVTHERAPALLGADQSHRLQFGVHPGSRHDRDSLVGGELAMGG